MTVTSVYQAGCREEYGKDKTWLTALLMAVILIYIENRSMHWGRFFLHLSPLQDAGGATVNFTIMPEAVQAYKKYADFREGECYRFYVRTGGPGTGGLFYAVEKSSQDEIGTDDVLFEVEGICFWIRGSDAWYFDGGTLSYNKYLGEYGFEFCNPSLE